MKGRSVLITGGTGSFGKRFTKRILEEYPNIERIVIYSRDELKQSEMKKQFEASLDRLRFFIGDVRDVDRLTRAMQGVDHVIHAAALKQVDTAEYNPDECIKTNVGGASSVVNAAVAAKVRSVVALSTDKACAPINLYGATKLVSDKIFTSANNIVGSQQITFSVVRYGNVMGSRGSVIPFFKSLKATGVIPITDTEMTRFNISLDEGIDLVFHAFNNAIGGEIFIPKIPSYKVLDVAKAVCPECKTKIVGIRPGEKIHEEMISETDALSTIETSKHYIILPSYSDKFDLDDYQNHHRGSLVKRGFSYSSGSNTVWESVESLRNKISKI